ncbi:MAG: VCBS repeat-containing protein, partial [Planctomycetota bacterium]
MARSHLFTLSAVLALTSAAGAQTPFGDVAGLTTALPCIDSLVTADFDGDGDQDILVGSVIGTQLRWCENLGSGELANPQLLAGTAAAYSIDAADLDGDGLPEAIAVDRNSGSLLWFRNLGGGAFAQFQFASTSVPGARWVEAADIDGDGDMDLVAAAEFGNSVVWVENLGGGAFGLTREVDNSASRPLSLGTGDFDGDGDLDVAALLAGTDVVVWYENRGGGSFGPQNLIAPFPMVRAEMEVADYDGDGALDVLFTADDCFVRGCAGSGLGSFAAPVALTTTNLCAGPTDLDLGDHDLDGDADLLTTNFGVTVSWTEQLSPGQFAPTAGVQFGFFQC